MYYELSFLTPNLKLEERDNLLKKISEEIEKLNGKVEEKLIEKKFFASPVKKNQEGFLGVVNFIIERNKIKELYRFLRSNESFLRIILEERKKPRGFLRPERIRRKIPLVETERKAKKEKVKIEELDKKLEEILK
jgi:ribosomal protein S6